MAGSRQRPIVVAFDVVGTLFSLEPMGRRLTDAGLPDGALGEWFARFLRDAMALDAAGIYVAFREIAAATLEVMLVEKAQNATKPTIETILRAVAELPAHPDVQPAFEQLNDAGVRIIALTNGSAATTGQLLKSSKLDGFVERIVSIDDIKHWKPRREVYLYAAAAAGVSPDRMALVAAHAWDILGASRAGLMTGWVARKEKKFHAAMGTPTVAGQTLTDVVAALLAH